MGSKKKAERKHILSKKCWCKPRVEDYSKKKNPLNYNLNTALRVIELKDQAIAKLSKKLASIQKLNVEEARMHNIAYTNMYRDKDSIIANLRSELASKLSEIDRLKREVDDYQRVVLGYMVTTFVKPIVDQQRASAEVRK